jgi:hypothetical protein
MGVEIHLPYILLPEHKFKKLKKVVPAIKLNDKYFLNVSL